MVKKVKRVLAVMITLVLMVSMLSNSKLIVLAENSIASEQESTKMETITGEVSAMEGDKQAESSTVEKGVIGEQKLSEDTKKEMLAGERDKTKEEITTSETEAQKNTSEKAEKVTASSEENKQEKLTVTEINEASEQETKQESADTTAVQEERQQEIQQNTADQKEETLQATTEQPKEDALQSTTEQGQQDTTQSAKEQEVKPYEAETVVDQTRIKVTAKAGVLPNDAVLKATALKEDGETSAQYSEAKAALDKDSSIEYDGFMAYDIGFTDSTGQEIEPTGKVSVSMEMATPEGAKTESLSVQHHEKTDAGIQVETVADAKNETTGKVDVQGQETVAEFEVESFSTFTITWSSGGWWNKKQVTVKYVDQNGSEISCTSASAVTVGMEDTITLADYAYSIDGYEYIGAKLNSTTGKSLTQMRASENSYGYGYYLQYKNGDDRWENLPENAEVLLVYNGSTPVDPTPVPEIKLAHDKYVTSNNNGTYDLTLTVSGDIGSQEKKQKVDIIYVLDKSGSMKYKMNENENGSGTDYRRVKAGDAINAMTNSLVANNNLDVRFSLVTFSKYEETTVGWTSNAADITSKSKPSSDGGTNYQGGLMGAKNLLKTKRSDAITVVVFVSDGDPTYYYNSNGKIAGTGNSDKDNLCLDAAKKEVSNLNANYFFTVGVGPSGNYQKLRDLKDAAVNVPEANRGFYEGTDTESLENAFNDIQSSITYLTCTDVTVTDNLTDNVKIVTENGQPKALFIEVVDENGQTIVSGNNEVTISGKTITAAYNADNKQIVLNFPNDYALEKGYTYKVTATIEATEDAYKAYRDNNNQYPDTGENGTGATSAGQAGVFTNTGATVNYIYNEEPKELEYPKPVIQLNPGTLVIEKEITGLDNDQEALNALKASLVFDVSLNNATESEEYKISAFTYNEESKKYTYTINGLSPNTSYKITEKGTTVSGYDLTQTPASGDAEGTVAGGETKTVAFTNAYTPSNRTITVKKVVDGNMSDSNKEFDFTYKIEKEGKDPVEGSFKLKDGAAHNIEEIPSGSTVTITETDNDGYKTSWSIGGNTISENQKSYSCDVTENMTSEDKMIVCTNTKNAITPTGMTHTQTPFALMLITALFLAVCGFGGFMFRRVRGRR